MQNETVPVNLQQTVCVDDREAGHTLPADLGAAHTGISSYVAPVSAHRQIPLKRHLSDRTCSVEGTYGGSTTRRPSIPTVAHREKSLTHR